MGDVLHQQFILRFGATETEETFNYADLIGIEGGSGVNINASKAFAYVGNFRHQTSGRTDNAQASDPMDNTGANIKSFNNTSITVEREPTGASFDYTLIVHVVEYTGAPGGPDEFIPVGAASVTPGLANSQTMSVGTAVTVDTVLGVPVGDILEVVPFPAGVRGFSTTAQNYTTTLHTRTLNFFGSPLVFYSRGAGISDDHVTRSFTYFVWFKGSNWTVQRLGPGLVPTVRGVAEIHTLPTDVGSWDNAFIVFSMLSNPVGFPFAYECAALVYPGATSTQVKTYVAPSFDTGPPDHFKFFMNIVSNSSMQVDHGNSIDGPGEDLPTVGPLGGISARSIPGDYTGRDGTVSPIFYHTPNRDDLLGDALWNANDSWGWWVQFTSTLQMVFARELGVEGTGGPWSAQLINWPPFAPSPPFDPGVPRKVQGTGAIVINVGATASVVPNISGRAVVRTSVSADGAVKVSVSGKGSAQINVSGKGSVC